MNADAMLDIDLFFRENLQPSAFAVQRARERLKALQSGAVGFKTRLPALDEYVRLMPGQLLTIAGRSGTGKCLGKGTRVVMYDGTLKNVEDVRVDDLLMGADSTSRRVLALGRGREMMYWIHQTGGVSYRVNEGHILSLRRARTEGLHRRGDILNISVAEAKGKGSGFYARYKGYKVAIEFAEQPVPVDPYFLGLWLGDGKSEGSHIYTKDTEIVDYLNEYATQRGEVVTTVDLKRPCPAYRIGRGHRGGSHEQRAGTLQAELNKLGVLNNKHIPIIYLRNSTENRLALLAGLLDSDGHLGRTGCYEISSKLERLATEIKFLADSLGFRTSIAERIARSQNGTSVKVWRVFISGDIDRIPCRVVRKRAAPRRTLKDWRTSGIRIEPDCVDDYYGFVLDGDRLFLLEDMTVTHNTAFGMQLVNSILVQMRERDDPGVVCVFSAEMDGEALMLREACAVEKISFWRVQTGDCREEEYRRLDKRLEQMGDTRLFIDESPAPTLEHMTAQLKALADDGRAIALVLFDYTELAGEFDREESRRVNKISRGLATLAKKFACPVVTLSQLNRDIEARSEKTPSMRDLMHGGERDAACIVILVRPWMYDKSAPRELVNAHVVKNRFGPQGEAKLGFDETSLRFYSVKVQKP